MRIVMTTDHFPPSGGGVEVVIAEVAPRLVAAGHQVMVITLAERADLGPAIYRGVHVEALRGIRLNRLTGMEVRVSPEALWRMRSVISSFSPDIVNAHHAFFTTSPIAVRAARDLGVPSVLTLHIAQLDALEGIKGMVARTYERHVARRVIGAADAIIGVSHAAAATAGAKDVFVVHNGVDTERFRPSPLEDAGGPTKILFVGRLIANKGPDVMIRAFAEVSASHPTARLTMVGDGPMRRRLVSMADRLGVSESVLFTGMRTDVDAMMQSSHIFVRSSLVEGMPLTILEAMASGLPTVASDLPGVDEALVDGETGLLVHPGSHRSTARAILRLIEDQDLRSRLSTNARARVVADFSWDETTRKTEQAYLKISRSSR